MAGVTSTPLVIGFPLSAMLSPTSLNYSIQARPISGDREQGRGVFICQVPLMA
jgi:hypothetical protein